MKTLPRSTFSRLFELGRLMRRRMSDGATLTLPQVEALHFIRERGEPKMGELAARLQVSAPTATALVQELVKAGLVTRKSSATDRRHISLALTKKAAQLMQATDHKRERVITALLKGLSTKDRAEFDRILEKILSTNI